MLMDVGPSVGILADLGLQSIDVPELRGRGMRGQVQLAEPLAICCEQRKRRGDEIL
jgi:hypothetical protein